jgi:hypothetical protein
MRLRRSSDKAAHSLGEDRGITAVLTLALVAGANRRRVAQSWCSLNAIASTGSAMSVYAR